MSTAERELRAAQNQVLFREVNDRIKELSGRALGPAAEVNFACECDNPECHNALAMSIADFAAIEGAGTNRFIISPGHEDDGVEDVIARRESFFIVAKRGAGAEFVEQRA